MSKQFSAKFSVEPIILMLRLYLTALVILIGGAINAILEESSQDEYDENDAAKDQQVQSDSNDIGEDEQTEVNKNETDNRTAP